MGHKKEKESVKVGNGKGRGCERSYESIDTILKSLPKYRKTFPRPRIYLASTAHVYCPNET